MVSSKGFVIGVFFSLIFFENLDFIYGNYEITDFSE